MDDAEEFRLYVEARKAIEKGDREQAKRQRTEAQRSSKAATSNKRGKEEDISSPSSEGSKLQKRDEIQ